MTHPLPTRRQAYLSCLAAAVTAVVCACLLALAVLVPAPPLVLPLVVAICIGCPMALAWNLPISIAVLRATSGRVGAVDSRMLKRMRRTLDRLPETEHPLGY